MNQTAKNRVLVVDDEALMRDLLKEVLKDQGFEVVALATNGQDAIEKVKTHQPDIVCLDINMPEVSGLDALASIKTINSAILVIMVTAVSDASEVQQAIRTGADGYLLKPFTGQQINQAVMKARKRKQAAQASSQS